MLILCDINCEILTLFFPQGGRLLRARPDGAEPGRQAVHADPRAHREEDHRHEAAEGKQLLVRETAASVSEERRTIQPNQPKKLL